MIRKGVSTLIIILSLIVFFPLIAKAEENNTQSRGDQAESEIGSLSDSLESLIGHREDDFIEVYDTEGNYIFGTCMGVSVGDRYINEENKHYRVSQVKERKATAEYLGEVNLLEGEDLLGSLEKLPPLVQGKEEKKVGLYHTHSAESYRPGPAFDTQRGEIYDVGLVLAKELEKKGIQVLRSDDSFLPHDAGAYERSRGTAGALIKQGCDAVFDIHRDAIPDAEAYRTWISGKEMSKIRLVVGRQNPNMNTNEELAKRLKAIADKKYPGLIKGIFYADGKYNQDLSPRTLLFEFGTHVTTEEVVLRSTSALADSINTLLYGTNAAVGGGEQGTDRAMGRAGWTNLLWILGFLVVGGAIYLFVNEKGLSGFSNRLKEFTGEEFANIFGRVKKKDQKSTNKSGKKDKE